MLDWITPAEFAQTGDRMVAAKPEGTHEGKHELDSHRSWYIIRGQVSIIVAIASAVARASRP